MKRPKTIVILAMTTDGKIADRQRSAARFASAADKIHLEKQIALTDAVIFGAATLRAYCTSLPITNLQLLQLRQDQGKPPQPVHIVCSASGKIDQNLRFFSQPIPRWLLTTPRGAKTWQSLNYEGFERVLVTHNQESTIDWINAFEQLLDLGIEKLAILGGGELVASLFELDLIDEIWLTLCPIILGGANAPTPVGGTGFPPQQARHLELLSLSRVGDEIFLHYRVSGKSKL
jgi:5-amino-6-(5-phosphoribosylamino)uracil reductase